MGDTDKTYGHGDPVQAVGHTARVIRYPQQTTGYPASVAALGFFDGVHPAHRSILSSAREAASARGLPFLVITFPSESDQLKPTAPRLCTTEEKIDLLAEAGADAVVLLDFDAVSAMSPQDFVARVLVDRFGVQVAAVGYNYRFGRAAAGDTAALSALLAASGGEVMVMPERRFGTEPLSTTLIRRLISEGRMAEVTAALGRPFRIGGIVTHGRGMGTGLGIPTANTALSGAALLLPHGVYRAAVPIGDRLYTGVTNVGVCPTFGARDVHAETLIVDFAGDLYEQTLDIFLLEFLRPERCFPDRDSLLAQIEKDKNDAIRRNGGLQWQDLGQNSPSR